MKRLFIVLLVAVGVIFVASAQTAGKKRSALHVSFCPPLSTHGAQAAGYSNKVSFNVLTGVSRDEECFTFGGLANIIYRNANGLQFAGLVNYVGHDGRGVLFGGLTNLVGNDYCGLQFAGLFNTATGLRGVQFAGLLNVADGMKGVLFGGLANICGRAVVSLTVSLVSVTITRLAVTASPPRAALAYTSTSPAGCVLIRKSRAASAIIFPTILLFIRTMPFCRLSV